jgi:hypothetical protein
MAGLPDSRSGYGRVPGNAVHPGIPVGGPAATIRPASDPR